MSYLKEFTELLQEEKLSPFIRLWEEYCQSDNVDGKELAHVLELIRDSFLAATFGQLAETVLPMWQKIDHKEHKNNVLRLILDVQTSNSPLFADLALDYLKTNYIDHDHFSEKLRLVGLRSRHNFQGAITNFELLSHMNKGNFVFHLGGWGVGEVMEISILQEHVLLEFEGIGTLKDLSFDNAFKNLKPLSSDHFLSRRFGNPDKLEEEAKEDPAAVIRLLLKDLGPKTAQEIKEELVDLVIPEAEWTKWWQTARTKVKKDTKVKSPKSARDPFVLREEEVPHDVRLREAVAAAKNQDAIILLTYNFVRDFPEVLKNAETKQLLKERLMATLEGDPQTPILSLARKLQACFLLEDIFPGEFPGASSSLIESIENLEDVINQIEITAFRKRVLSTAREVCKNWLTLFLSLLFKVPQNYLRDYIFKELMKTPEAVEVTKEKVRELLHNMNLHIEPFFWYFQKVAAGDDVPYTDKESKLQFLEAALILLHYIEEKEEYRDLAKKMHALLVAKRYVVIREIIEGSSIDYLREFLLLASKCHSFTKQDMRILDSLAEVVQPSLAKQKDKKVKEEEQIIWTTPEGFKKLQERIQEIGTVEILDNAREIEAARALGDLRENSEYKFALERRSRLQAELKTLSEQINQARVLTKQDIFPSQVGPGIIVDVVDSKGIKKTYTLLGPWDADPDKQIVSFQSKFSQAMNGKKKGDTFQFQGEDYTVVATKSYLS
ncbi:MAG: GreA/GreB family elongation factor [Chlamydiales bacterium]